MVGGQSGLETDTLNWMAGRHHLFKTTGSPNTLCMAKGWKRVPIGDFTLAVYNQN